MDTDQQQSSLRKESEATLVLNSGGGDRTRTRYLLLAKQPLSQLSYTPQIIRILNGMVGLVGLEPTTPALSRRCSNQLSYRPKPVAPDQAPSLSRRATTFQQPISVGV